MNNVTSANEYFRQITKQERATAEAYVNVHGLQVAEILIEATKDNEKPWPLGSLTNPIIASSQVLTDLFVLIDDKDRTQIVRDIKFIYQNFDAIQDFVALHGWRSLGRLRKGVAKAEKEQAAADTPDTGDTGEDTEEDTTPNGQRDDYASSIYALLIKAEQAGHDPAEVIQDVVSLFKNK